jgi:transposase
MTRAGCSLRCPGRLAQNSEGLAEVDEEGYVSILRMLSERREDLVQERTRTLNRLHRLLRDLLPGGASTKLSAKEAARALRRVRARSIPERTRRQLASELVRDVRRLDRLVCELEQRIREALRESGTSLTKIFGIGPLLAAKIIGRVGSVARFSTKGHFASYTGTAPIEASSADVVRHRLSRVGDRQLNSILHIIAICQVRHGAQGREYYQRKLSLKARPEEKRSGV